VAGFGAEPEIEALLGAATIGFLPAISALDEAGGLHPWARARLAVMGVTPEAALAAMIAGDNLLTPPRLAAGRAMHDALRPHLHIMPARPELPFHAPAIRRKPRSAAINSSSPPANTPMAGSARSSSPCTRKARPFVA
jgi:hypothetical protein